jgi:Mn2+/Fe2+ NRAMP family transporter
MSSSEAARDASTVSTIESPPHTMRGIVRRLGPGLIIAGSIVGSGELIATTKTGAQAGFWLLWLILLGCVIKVFVQVEFGRYSIVNGRTTMDGLNEVPGPRLGRGSWIVWYWFIMFLASMGQLGGIVGGVGQAMSISVPLTERGQTFNEHWDQVTKLQVKKAEMTHLQSLEDVSVQAAAIAVLAEEIASLEQSLGERPPPATPVDQYLWAALITIVTSVVLVMGRYGLIQSFATAMVAIFTLVTVLNLIMLQVQPTWMVTWDDLRNGLSFALPPASKESGSGFSPLGTALATFGIIGVGASELVAYPYWCVEKGYARFTGPRQPGVDWAARASGWMRVMRWDVWCSMVIYTFATIAFYLLGAAILGRTGLNPSKEEMVRTLAVMYEPVFGKTAPALFLFGAFAVLYSTFFVANASLARIFADVLRVLGLTSTSAESYRRRVRLFSGLLPLVCLLMYVCVRQPALLVLISGLIQAIMLPMLSGAALFFRYRRSDDRISPTKLWDIFLWLSTIGMLITGLWAAYETVESNGPAAWKAIRSLF